MSIDHSGATKSGKRVKGAILLPLPVDWETESESFATQDQRLNLFAVTHHKKDWKSPRALIIFHGLGEHGGRYLHTPHYLHETLEAIRCVDQRGHGRAEGLRGHVENFDQFADDAAVAIRRFHDQIHAKFGKAELRWDTAWAV